MESQDQRQQRDVQAPAEQYMRCVVRDEEGCGIKAEGGLDRWKCGQSK